MSGGFWNYKEKDLKNEIFGYGSLEKRKDGSLKIPDVLEDKELSELTYDLLELLDVFDYYTSGDTDEEYYLEKKKVFKEKWLKDNSAERTKKIVDESVEDLKEELYRTFDISND